jgi:glycerol uptake facilitator-like aquaporin
MTFLTHGAGSGRILMAVWVLTVFCWKVSGSHFNPIISFAYMFRKETNKPRLIMLFYCLVQVLGAFFGCLLMAWLQEDLAPIGPSNQDVVSKLGHNKVQNCYRPQDNTHKHNVFRAVIQEIVGSFIFVFFFMTQTEQ